MELNSPPSPRLARHAQNFYQIPSPLPTLEHMAGPRFADFCHQRVIEVITSLVVMDPPLDSPEGKLLSLLAIAIETFEKEHYPIEAPDDPAR
jgi:hypothetical protein